MTNNSGPSVLRVLRLPELLSSVGSHLTPPHLLSCVQVCRDWSQIFIPLLWRTINDQLYSWPRIFKNFANLSTPEEQAQREDWMHGIFVKYGRYIRNLDANGFITIISAQVAANCTHLRTLAVAGSYEQQRFQGAQSLEEQVRYDVTPIEAQACLSKSFISPVFEGVLSLPPPSPSNEANALQWWHQWVFTQRFWLLVLQNPQLEGLRLGKNFSSLRLDFKTDSSSRR